MENTGTTKQVNLRAANGLCVQLHYSDGHPVIVKIAHKDWDGAQVFEYGLLLQAAQMVLAGCGQEDRWYMRPHICEDHGPHGIGEECPGCAADADDAPEIR